MTESEYDIKLKQIEEEAKAKRIELIKNYANDLVIFSIGDIVKTESSTIKIDKISAYRAFSYPMPTYSGYELKKDLTPRKDSARATIYGNREVQLIKKG